MTSGGYNGASVCWLYDWAQVAVSPDRRIRRIWSMLIDFEIGEAALGDEPADVAGAGAEPFDGQQVRQSLGESPGRETCVDGLCHRHELVKAISPAGKNACQVEVVTGVATAEDRGYFARYRVCFGEDRANRARHRFSPRTSAAKSTAPARPFAGSVASSRANVSAAGPE